MTRNVLSTLLVFAVLLILSGCGSASFVFVPSLSVDPSSQTLSVGESTRLNVTSHVPSGASNGQGQAIMWTASTPTVASVDAYGMTTCRSIGTGVITAMKGTASASATVSCSAPHLSIGGLTTLYALGQTTQLFVTASYANTTSSDLTASAAWQSGSPSLASVNDHGLVTCNLAGTTKISASAEGATASVSVTCSTPKLMVTSNAFTEPMGRSSQLHATLTYTNGIATDITTTATWLATTPTIASVNQLGLYTCKSVGSAVIAVSSGLIGSPGYLSSSVTVSCLQTITSLTVAPSSISTRVGTPIQLTVNAMGQNGPQAITTSEIGWNSSSSIASVSNTGVVSCVGAGSVTLTASYSSFTAPVSLSCAPRSMNTPSYFAEQSDDFVGPFPSWSNVRSYGAKGDGMADDTTAIQQALDTLNQPGASPVLWFPAGRYRITRPLYLTHKTHVSLIGEESSSTSIVWGGPDSSTMLFVDGSNYFKISRFTFDGSGVADTAENITNLGSGGFYSTFNDLSDQHITRVNYGIRLSVDAETAIQRILFDALPTAVSLGNFNTLNIFIKDSLFAHCGKGVTNEQGGGSFIVSNSFFDHSTVADMVIYNTGYFTARHNTTVGSATFFYSDNSGANNGTITLQNNTILDPLTAPIHLGNLGPLMLIDNVVRQRDSSIPVVAGSNDMSAPKAVVSIGNTFSPNPGPLTDDGSQFQGTWFSQDDSISDPSAIADVMIPSDVYHPADLHGTVFEVSDFTGIAVQTAIDKAVASGLPHAVVHLADGTYVTNRTITIPSAGNLDVTGDDVITTQVLGSTSLQGPVLQIMTSNTNVKNLHVVLRNVNTVDGIVMPLIDQANTEVIIDQAMLQNGNAYSVNFDGVEHLTAEMFNTYSDAAITGINVLAGPFRAAKESTLGITNLYSGSMQSGGNGTSFNVSDGGKFMVQDDWHDNGATSPVNFSLSGSGTVTEQVGVVYTNSPTPFQINNFDGQVSLIGLQFSGNGFQLTPGSNHTDLLDMGLVGSSSKYVPSSEGNLTVGNIANSYYVSSGGVHIADPAPVNSQWLRKMLAETRSEYPMELVPVSAGTSRIRLGRVAVDNAASAIHITAAVAPTGLYFTLSSGEKVLSSSSSCMTTEASTPLGGGIQWILSPGGEGDYQLAPAGSESVLGIQSNDQSGNAVSLSTRTSAYSQRWTIQKRGDGRVLLINRATGDLLSIAANGCAGLSSGAITDDTSWTITAH